MPTILFDFDGTLANTFFIAVDVFRRLSKVARRRGPTDDAEVEVLRGLSARQAMKRVGLHWWQLPYVLHDGRKTMHHRMHEVQAFPGITKVLEQLHRQGYQLMVVSTNGDQNIQLFLQNNHLQKYIARVYAHVGLFSKARALRDIMKEHHLTAANCVYVGDEVRDLDATRRAGLRCISVSWGYNNRQALQTAGADPIVDTSEQLAKAIHAAVPLS